MQQGDAVRVGDVDQQLAKVCQIIRVEENLLLFDSQRPHLLREENIQRVREHCI